MIYITLGGNEASSIGSPEATLIWSLRQMPQFQTHVKLTSAFYLSDPVGQEGQEAYVNAVAIIETQLSPQALLKALKQIEAMAGRNVENLKTRQRWGSRPLDLDILDYHGAVTSNYGKHARVNSRKRFPPQSERVVLPHPRLAERPFVIRPLMDIAPLWRHPATGQAVTSLWARLCRTRQGRILSKITNRTGHLNRIEKADLLL